MNANLRNFALWIIIVLLLLALFTVLQNPGQRTQSTEISFSQLLSEVDKERVKEVVIQGPEIHGTFTDGRQFQTYSPNDPSLIQRLYSKGVARCKEIIFVSSVFQHLRVVDVDLSTSMEH